MSKKIIDTVSMDWKPDKNSTVPLHSQIVKYFINKISKGDWLIGNRLPSQRELAKIFEINRSTVVEALSELTSLGIIESNYSQGTKIINSTWSLLISSAPPNWKGYINSGIHNPNKPTIQLINKLEFKKNIVRLSTGELSPDLLPIDMTTKVLTTLSKESISLNYLEPLGLLELRQALSKYLTKYGMHVPPSCILIVSGSLQALHLISIGMLKPNSTIYTEKISYLKSLRIFQSVKMNVLDVPMDNNGIIPTMIDYNGESKETSILYTIPTFHNPTGIVMSEERRAELLNWCRMKRLPLIEDDAYRELWFENPPPLPLKSYDEYGTVLYLGSISKSLAPGFRLGWLIGPEAIIEHLGDIKMQVDYGANSLSQVILSEWIKNGSYDQYLQFLRTKLKERRDVALQILKSYFHDIATWKIPTGGFYIWLKLKNNKISTSNLFKLAIKNSLLINPGSIYDSNKNQYIRISYSYADIDKLSSGLKKLAELIRSLY